VYDQAPFAACTANAVAGLIHYLRMDLSQSDDYERLKAWLATRSADTVFAVHLLEHLPRGLDAEVLAEMLRVARRRAVVAVPFEDEPTPAWGHVRTFDLDDLHALGASTGLPYTVDEHHGGWLVIDPQDPQDSRDS